MQNEQMKADAVVPLTFLVAQPIETEIKAAQAHGYAMEIDTKQPNGDGSDTV
ncbi:MAG: hypothetical protein WAX57_02760 [Minisyncoccia bacterium]